MTDGPLTDAVRAFTEAAAAIGLVLHDGWGRTFGRLETGVTPPRLRSLSDLVGVSVDVFVGEDEERIRFGPDAPTSDERSIAADLLAVPSDKTAAFAEATGYDLVGLVAHEVRYADITFAAPRWARTIAALEQAVAADWLAVVEDLRHGSTVTIDGTTISLSVLNDEPLVVGLESSDAPDIERTPIRDVLNRLADAQAWVALSTRVERQSNLVRVALHADQESLTPVTPATAGGGLDLLRWLRLSQDGNRIEALRHVLRSAMVVANNRLPEARAVRALAEQERIALSRDNAAAVQSAIEAAYREAGSTLRDVADGLAAVVDGVVRGASATTGAALAVVTVIARDVNAIPAWLIWLVTLSALAGICLALESTVRRLGDYKNVVDSASRRVKENPLVPETDSSRVTSVLTAYRVDGRARRATRQVALMSAFTAAILLLSAFWLTTSADSEVDTTPSVISTP